MNHIYIAVLVLLSSTTYQTAQDQAVARIDFRITIPERLEIAEGYTLPKGYVLTKKDGVLTLAKP